MNRDAPTSSSSAALPKYIGPFPKSFYQQGRAQGIGTRSASAKLKQLPDIDSDGYRIIRRTKPVNAEKMAQYENASHLQGLLITWMVIADNTQAQIYEGRKIAQDIVLGKAAKRFNHNKKSGREWTLISNGIIAAEAADNCQEQNFSEVLQNVASHQNFIHTIIERLHSSFSQKLFDRLVLVASPRVIVDLKERLNAGVQDSIVGIMSRNLADY